MRCFAGARSVFEFKCAFQNGYEIRTRIILFPHSLALTPLPAPGRLTTLTSPRRTPHTAFAHVHTHLSMPYDTTPHHPTTPAAWLLSFKVRFVQFLERQFPESFEERYSSKSTNGRDCGQRDDLASVQHHVRTHRLDIARFTCTHFPHSLLSLFLRSHSLPVLASLALSLFARSPH